MTGAADLGTAVDREAAWLATTGDGLPSLLTANGGPWDVIQAYMPRTPAQRKSQVYVLRRRTGTRRFAQQRRIPSHQFHLVCQWPIGGTTTAEGIAEQEQRAFDAALALLVQRLEGFTFDKTHGGAFKEVAEGDGGDNRIDVEYVDPAQTIANGAFLQAFVTYAADDSDYYI